MVAPPLLALPGELRNRIYEFCVEPKALYIPRHPKRTKKHYAHARWGLYGSLRNVCRQTRAEFGSSYMAKNVMVLHQITANAFLKTFYPDLRQPKVPSGEPPLERGTADSSAQGNILIMSYFGQPYDATPLARLCMNYPNFNVTFTDASACLRLAVLLDGFFANISSGTFRPDFERLIQKVEISCSMQPEMRFTFQSRRAMEDFVEQSGIADPRQVLMKMGAPPMNGFAILFGDDTGDVYKHSALSL